MMRWNGSAAVRWGLVTASVALLAGCAQPGVVAEDTPVSPATSPLGPNDQAAPLAETAGQPLPAEAAAAPVTAPLEIREIKLIDDNGQQGLFVKLTDKPTAVTHLTLGQPTRLVIDIAGSGGAGTMSAQKYAVKNPLVSEIRVARNEGKIRVSLYLRVDKVPTYTVSDLSDSVVAFLGEPTGGTLAIHEQLVFTRRAGAMAPAAADDAGDVPPPAQRTATTAQGQPVPGWLRNHPTYVGQHVSLDFKDADVHNVLRLLAEVSKLNVVATDDVRGKVTLRLFDVPWDQALDILLQTLNLESEQEGNVIRISTVKRLREEREELQKAQEAAKVLEPLRVDYIKVNYIKAIKLAEIISGAARTRSATAMGRSANTEEGVLSSRGSVFVDEFSNTIVVRDIQRGVDSAHDLARRLDVQTPQVLIESSIIEATTDFARDLGIQWGYTYLQGPATGNPTGVNFPGTIGFGGSGLGTGVSGVPFLADFPAASVAPGMGSALNLALGSIDGSQSLDIRITALEKSGKARIVSKPRVVTLNNVAATIKSLTILRVRLPSTGTLINTGAGGAVGGATAATEKIETGIILIVTPQVSSDGFVLLDMAVKSSQADFTGPGVDSIPNEISREANSHILVKNGQTVVLGGIYRDNVNENQSGLPFLQNIPGLGWLFRSQSKLDHREDLLVFLTPRILGGGPGAGLPQAEDLWRNRDATN